MQNSRTIAGISTALLLGLALPAFGADIVGTVADPSGAPIPGVTVSVATRTGTQVGTATSDTMGRYELHGITPGIYTLSAHGQSAVSYVGNDGLTVDWGIAPNAPTIATAHQGTGAGVGQAVGNDRLVGFAADEASQGGKGQK